MENETSFSVSRIRWDNIHLYIYVKCDISDNALFYFAEKECEEEPIKSPRHIISDVKQDEEGFELELNITQAMGRSFPDNGKWVIMAVCGEKSYMVNVEPECAYSFPDLSRVFRYEERKAYVITFDAEETEAGGQLRLVMNSTFMKVNDKWRDRREGVKGTLLGALKASSGKEHAHKKMHVLFMTETSDGIKGNLKAVYEKALERHMDEKAEISIYARSDADKGLGAKGLLKLKKLIADQDVIVVDDYVPVFSYLDPPKGARLIQLWHAVEGFKSVGYSRFGKTGSPHPQWSCHRKYTDVFAPHEDLIDVYSEVFGVEREAFTVHGFPRLDGFADTEKIEKTRGKLFSLWPELKGKKVILFAPTYRGTGQRDAYYDYDKLDLYSIADVCDEDTVFAFKMHPFIDERVRIPEDLSDKIIDLTGYGDINDLYYISDLLITDYSSDFFEYALLGKPVLFYTYDRDMYQITRGVHRDIKETAPGKVCDTFDELIRAIRDKDYDFDKTEEFCRRYRPMLDMHAADDIVDDIFGSEER